LSNFLYPGLQRKLQTLSFNTHHHMNYLQITIPVEDAAIQEILIARLSDTGYEGFEQQEKALEAFIPESGFDRGLLQAILSDFNLEFTSNQLAARNWNEEWEKNFDPVIVEGFCAIRANFHPPVPGVQHELLITPKMSFGTGHHATTYMMMESMEYLDFKGRRALDFGTGTGVLAILAEKLGADSILAIDYDDWSIENAKENVTANSCSKITLVQMDTIPANDSYDIILANINKNVILYHFNAIGQQLRQGGVILLSGLLVTDLEDIEKEAVRNNYSISGRLTKNNWICLKLEKKHQ
jgi:ribosomal protein L11 methyltransferase